MESSLDRHIEVTPEKCGGRPCIAGTRVRVQDIVRDHELHGLTAEQIAREYPQFGRAQVHAALAFYFDHREKIQRQIREDEEFVAEAQRRVGARMSRHGVPLVREL